MHDTLPTQPHPPSPPNPRPSPPASATKEVRQYLRLWHLIRNTENLLCDSSSFASIGESPPNPANPLLIRTTRSQKRIVDPLNVSQLPRPERTWTEPFSRLAGAFSFSSDSSNGGTGPSNQYHHRCRCRYRYRYFLAIHAGPRYLPYLLAVNVSRRISRSKCSD